MLNKNLHKNGAQGVYREPMVVSKQALPKLCLFLPIVKKIQITFGGKFSFNSTLLSVYTYFVTQVKHLNILDTYS